MVGNCGGGRLGGSVRICGGTGECGRVLNGRRNEGSRVKRMCY